MRTILPYKLYFMLKPHHVISSFARHSNSSVVKLSLLFNLFYIYIYIYTSIDLDFNTRNDNIKNQYNFAVYSVLFSFIHYIRYAKSSCIDYRVWCVVFLVYFNTRKCMHDDWSQKTHYTKI